MLTDPERCQVVLVTLPEETPVNELVDTAYSLEDEVGVASARWWSTASTPTGRAWTSTRRPRRPRPGVALRRRARPRRWPPPAASAATGCALQAEQVGRLAAQLPLPQLPLPFLFAAELGPAELDLLADRACIDRARRPPSP